LPRSGVRAEKVRVGQKICKISSFLAHRVVSGGPGIN